MGLFLLELTREGKGLRMCVCACSFLAILGYLVRWGALSLKDDKTPTHQDRVQPTDFTKAISTLAVSKTGHFLSKAEIWGMSVFSPFQCWSVFRAL